MIKELFKKFSYNNETFLKELQSKNFNKKALINMLNSNKININHQNKYLKSFLHLTIENNNTQSANFLIDNKIDTTLEDNEFKTALQYAVKYNNYDIVKKLIDEDVIDKKDIYGRSLLQEATISGHHEVANLLIENKADINSKDHQGRNIIFDAITYGDKDFINKLLEYKELELNNIDINHDTIMHHQYIEENEDIALRLIEKGANTTIKNAKGETYLSKMALKGIDSYFIVEKAIKNGADINSSVSSKNNSILIELISVFLKNNSAMDKKWDSLMPVVNKLIYNGIDINYTNINGETALFTAIRGSNYKLTQILLNSGANPNIINNKKETSLYITALKGIKSILTLKVLLINGANPTIKNKDNKTLFEVLNDIVLYIHNKTIIKDKDILSSINIDGQYMLILREILKYNKDLSFLTTKGEPIFSIPFLYDEIDLFKLYINNGADINLLNNKNINLFYKFVLKVFEVNNRDIELKRYLSILVTNKANHNFKDNTGWNVLNKILSTNTDINMFDILIKRVRFDYKSKDNLGRTIIHTAVWFDKDKVIRTLSLIDRDVLNIADNYGILPITYAALLGNKKLVVLLFNLNSNIKSGIKISNNIKNKFSHMLKNLGELTINISNKELLTKINILIEQIKRDFSIPKEIVKK